MEQEYAREHGSSRTEVRGDGSIAEFSDPADGFEPEAPALVPEHGTDVVPDIQDDEDEQQEDGA